MCITNWGSHSVFLLNDDSSLVRVVGREGGGTGSERGEFRHPHGVCPGGFGRWIVADSGNERLSVLSREGEHVCHLLVGEKCYYVCVTGDGHLLVWSSSKINVYKYS